LPRIRYSLKAFRKKYAEGLERGMKIAIYSAYSELNKQAFKRILTTAPKSRTPSTRFPVGFVSSYIKLVLKRRPPYFYEEVDVPGKFNKGSRAWRAWIVIKTLHDGWTRLPFERKPTRKKAVALPVYPGSSVPRPGKKRLVYRKTVQRRQIRLNPWIRRTWQALEPEFPRILEDAVEKENRKRKKERIA